MSRTFVSWLIGGVGLIASIIAIVTYFESKNVLTVAGEWNILDTVAVGPYKGTVIEFRLFLAQNGKTISGTGEKVSVNGVPLPLGRRTAIEIVGGQVSGEEIKATFVEHGEQRQTRGEFSWLLQNACELLGEFRSTSSHGLSIGRKVTGECKT